MNETQSDASILIVDDVLRNIQVLGTMLRKAGYGIQTAQNGTQALKAVEAEPPDLILLDVMMPQMDGFETCKRLKAAKETRDIPIIFLTAKTETEEIVKGFELGAVDYLTKPVGSEELLVRVNTHLELKNARHQIEQLLSKTLMGSLKVLMDILSMVHPEIFSQASRLKRYAGDIARFLKLPGVWRFELAALLSHIGCIILPAETLKKLHCGQDLSKAGEEEYRTHPAVGRNLLSNIPRLELVAEMIGHQQDILEAGDSQKPLGEWDTAAIGGQILKAVIECDRLSLKDESPSAVLNQMRSGKGDYVPEVLDALEKAQTGEAEMVIQSVRLTDLREGMILGEDIASIAGVKLIGKGSELSTNLILFLKRFSKPLRIKYPIHVQVRDKSKTAWL